MASTKHVRGPLLLESGITVILMADELALIGKEDKMLHVLFSTIPDDLMLYDKPMARNVQLWTENGHLLLDGPNATPEQIKKGGRSAISDWVYQCRSKLLAALANAQILVEERQDAIVMRPATESP